MNSGLESTLILARAQLQRIEAGDVDGFVDAAPAYELSCEALGPAALVSADLPNLEELIALHTRISQSLDESMRTVGARMTGLQASRRLSTAYHGPGAVEPLQSRNV
jgi:hypothetical protein